jgi:hypothetical protein
MQDRKEYNRKHNQLPEVKKRHNEVQKLWRETTNGKTSSQLTQQKYYETHKEQEKEEARQYRLRHPEKQYEWNRSENGKKYFGKHVAKRRKLGYIPLNEMFEGAEGHHISQNFIIYIPHEIHRSIYHNIWTWRGMDAINKLAMEWL